MALDGFGRRHLGFLQDKSKKPQRWAFDKGLVDPKWSWVHDEKLINCLPFWDGAGSQASDISPLGLHGALTQIDWVPSSLGLGIQTTDGATDYAKVELSNSGLPIASATSSDWNMSLFIGMIPGDTVTNAGYFAISNTVEP